MGLNATRRCMQTRELANKKRAREATWREGYGVGFAGGVRPAPNLFSDQSSLSMSWPD